MFEKEIIRIIKKETKLKNINLEVPPNPDLGDFAFPCFQLAKIQKKAPIMIAQSLAVELPKIEGISEIKANGPYVNFFLDKKSLMKETLLQISKEKSKYGESTIGKEKTVVIDYSSPNIAKPFGIAHIRSTVIGNSLYKIHSALGYKVVRVNHLGDWGTQFGKLMVAYRKWGDEKKLEKEGICHLVDIYVKFGEEAEIDTKLEDEARTWFKRLEDGDKEAVELWELFREMSLLEFKRYYKRLDIEFDSYHGEAFYNDKLDKTIKEVQSKAKTEIDDGALIVKLPQSDKEEIPPILLRKSDGASTYHTRDLAAALYRLKEYKPNKVVYVVGAPQQLHFKQLFAVLEMMGIDKDKFVHVPFGNMTYEGQMMSTRTGNFVLLEEVLDQSIALALKTIEERNSSLKNKKDVAEIVGIGAIIFGDLVNDRVRDVDFTWEKALDFEGETGPYLQYTHARISSLLRKADQKISAKIDFNLLNSEAELVKQLEKFNSVIIHSLDNYKPHIIARYLLDTAQMFNSYYQNNPVLNQEKDLRNARLLVVYSVGQVLKNGLNLLGLCAPEEM